MWAMSLVVVSLLDYVNNNGVLKNSYNGVLHLEKIKEMGLCLARVKNLLRNECMRLLFIVVALYQ